MTREQTEKRERIGLTLIMGLMLMLAICVMATTIITHEKHKEEVQRQRQEIVKRIQGARSTEELSAGIAYMFHEATTTYESGGWETEEKEKLDESTTLLEGFIFYEIPSEFVLYGGEFSEGVQKYIYSICKQQGVRYALVVAMVEQESGYRYDCIGDDGNSKGYMQIFEKWHTERMEKLGVNDLMNPYQNVTVGIDFLSELLERYGTIQEALTAYNYGTAGAEEHLWSNGIYVYPYNERIIRRMKEIEEELGQ